MFYIYYTGTDRNGPASAKSFNNHSNSSSCWELLLFRLFDFSLIYTFILSNRDGPEWARQRQIIQKAMMHPTAATRYLHMQVPVVQDFVDYLDHKKEADGLVPDLYEDLFKYTMEGERWHIKYKYIII